MSGDSGTFLLVMFARSTQDEPHGSRTPYGYVPTESICILFVILFSFSLLLHTVQATYFRMWWILPSVCLCGTMEVLGWSARLWSSISPTSSLPFLIQITATILAPTPLVAANFVILGRIIGRLGPAYSRLSPKLYTIIFCTCDVISLVVQGVGGGLASTSGTQGNPAIGGNVMLGGIIFQTVTITVYVFCAIEFFCRYISNTPLNERTLEENSQLIRGAMDKRLRLMSFALGFSTVFLFIRAIYRTIELSDGWSGRIITTQIYFNVLDGGMIVLAMYTMNFVHPGIFLVKSSKVSDTEMKLYESNSSLQL